MLSWIRRNSELRKIGRNLYERIVAQARQPEFYSVAGVPDTMEGRFEMIVLHLFLVLERLKSEGDDGLHLGQRVMEHLVSDMDDALRQIGIGDMGVPRRIQKTAAAMRERIRDYDQSMDQADTLERTLAAHIFAEGYQGDGPHQIAEYVTATRAVLQGLPSYDVLKSNLAFAEVASLLRH